MAREVRIEIRCTGVTRGKYAPKRRLLRPLPLLRYELIRPCACYVQDGMALRIVINTDNNLFTHIGAQVVSKIVDMPIGFPQSTAFPIHTFTYVSCWGLGAHTNRCSGCTGLRAVYLREIGFRNRINCRVIKFSCVREVLSCAGQISLKSSRDVETDQYCIYIIHWTPPGF